MNKTIFSLITAIIAFQVWVGPAFAQYISESIPQQDRIRSIDVAELARKVENAKKLIEEKGEKAFDEFREESGKWLGKARAIFVVHAKKGDINEGTFVVYPAAENVGEGAFDMSKVNGKHFARKAAAQKEEKEPVWYGFIAGTPGQLPRANTIAVSPTGSVYAIAAGNENLPQEKHFLVEVVNAASEVVKQDGKKAFDIFSKEDSVFRFKNTYIYVMDGMGNMLFDPGNPEYVGNNIVDYPQMFPGYKYPVFSTTMEGAIALANSGAYPKTSEEFSKMFKNTVATTDTVWAAYLTAKPGEKLLSRKVSYHKAVTGGPDGKKYLVGSGVYLAGWER